jgi:two-component system CheB/CheR fusion protein
VTRTDGSAWSRDESVIETDAYGFLRAPLAKLTSSLPAGVAVVLVTAVVYAAAAKLGLSVAFAAEQVSAVWPPAGIALAAILLFGPPVIPGITLGAFVVNATADEPLATAAGIAIGNTLEAVTAALLLARFRFRRALERMRDVLVFVLLAVLASTTVAATVGVISLCAGGVQPWPAFVDLWVTWWIGDAMGVLIVAPLILVWVTEPPHEWGRARILEGAILLAALIAVSALIFRTPEAHHAGTLMPYQIFPFVIWGALRFRLIGATTVTFVAAALAIWSTVGGHGPFALRTAHESLIMLQLFEGVLATTGLLLASAISERASALARAAAEYDRLRTSEERLRLALMTGRMGVWDWDIASGTVTWSPGMEGIAGIEPGTFGGTMDAFMSLLHPDDRGRVRLAITRALEDTGDYDEELRVVGADRAVRWTVAKGTVIRDPQGKPMRMLGVAIEVTERRRLEDALRERAGELADADRRKDEFLAMLAHELRNPLAPLSNALHLLRMPGADRERFLEMAERQVRLLARLVDDLLDVSRITQGKITLRKESVLLGEVISQAVDTVRPEIESRSQSLTLSLPPQPLCVEADPARLSQVFANLLSNASKYTPAGGAIWLTAEPIGNEIAIRVRDSGVGLSPDLLPHVFDLFVQADVSLERARGGLGIGLTVVRRLVEMHAGRVEAHSAGTGQGSEFIVHLPYTEVSDLERWPDAPRTATVAGPLKVLVVEDNRDGAETLASILELWGHEVMLAFDGAAALDTAERFEPDVILSDIGLPGMNGFDLARQLRKHPAFGRVVLIAMSGYGREEDKRRAMEAGFDHHLVKPPDLAALQELFGRVAQAFGDRTSRTVH